MAILAFTEQKRLAKLEKVIESGKAIFQRVGDALAAIRSERLHRDKYETFEEYCELRWGFTRQRAQQLIAGAAIAGTVNQKVASGTAAVQNEKQARALALAEPDCRASVWQQAVAESPTGTPTAQRIKELVAKAKSGAPSARDELQGLSPDEKRAKIQDTRDRDLKIFQKNNADGNKAHAVSELQKAERCARAVQTHLKKAGRSGERNGDEAGEGVELIQAALKWWQAYVPA